MDSDPPVNPFHFWKDRLRDEEESALLDAANSRRGHGDGPGNLAASPRRSFGVQEASPISSSTGGVDSISATAPITKRRPPPSPPKQQARSSAEAALSSSCCSSARDGKLSNRGASVLQQPSAGGRSRAGVEAAEGVPGLGGGGGGGGGEGRGEGGGIRGRIDQLELESVRSGGDGCGQASASSSAGAGAVFTFKSPEKRLEQRREAQREDKGSIQDWVGKLEPSSRGFHSSDANSYIPSGANKSPRPVHKSVRKSTSSPVGGESPQKGKFVNKTPLPFSSTSCKKSIPTIQTTRASNGDQFSADDLDLYQLQKSNALSAPGGGGGGGGGKGGKVLEVAKRIDSVFLSPPHTMQAPSFAAPSGGDGVKGRRRGSSGDINRTAAKVS